MPLRCRVENTSLQQKSLDVFRLTLQGFFGQIVQDVTLTAGERRDETMLERVVASLDRERRQLQPGDPALRAGFQRADVLWRETQSDHVIEKRRGFFHCKTKLVRADFGELAAAAPTRERQRRIGAAGNDQVHVRRKMLDKKGDALVNIRHADSVIVVQYERELFWKRSHVVEQECQKRFGARQRLSMSAKHRQGVFAEIGIDRSQRGNRTSPEARRVAIAFVQGQPGHFEA